MGSLEGSLYFLFFLSGEFEIVHSIVERIGCCNLSFFLFLNVEFEIVYSTPFTIITLLY